MSDTFGALYIQGQQLNLPGGGPQAIGPFALPASGVQSIVTVNLVDNTVTVPVPTTAAGYPYNATGVLLVPQGITIEFQYKTVSGDTGIHGSPAYPSFLAFDLNNMPSNIYLTSTGTVSVVLQFL